MTFGLSKVRVAFSTLADCSTSKQSLLHNVYLGKLTLLLEVEFLVVLIVGG